MSKIQNSSLDIVQFMRHSHQHLPGELSSASLEHNLQKIKHVGYEQTSSIIREAIRDQVDSVGPSSEILAKIVENMSLRSNLEILIEAVALEKLKENAEQAERTEETEFVDQIIGLLMTDPVIVASGQTYERAFIKKWIDLGLTVCPKTRQTLARSNLIPNYTVKALIAHWCESNNVKLPDPMKSTSLNQSDPLVHAESGLSRDSNSVPHSRSSQPMSPNSWSTGQSNKNLITSSGLNQEVTSPLHPRSTSEGSLSGIDGNGDGLDVARVSLSSDEDISNLEQRDSDSVGQPPMSSSIQEFHNSGQSSLNHTRSISASSTLTNSDFPRGQIGDANETFEESTHFRANSDDTGEVKSDLQPVVSSDIPRREVEFSPQFMDPRSRIQTKWRRPSERFMPRIIASSRTGNRDDLSGTETQVKKLVEDLKSTSVDTQREATGELRLLAKHNMDNRIIIANCGAITLLVDLLCSPDTKTQENAVTALLNLSINDNNKAAIANANAIEPLIHVLETGSPEAKENAAATLFSLSVIEDNKVKIGRSGAIGPLVDLLGNGWCCKTPCGVDGPAGGMVDKGVAVLANLATIPEGRTTIGQEQGIPVLVEVVELGSARGKENAAAALLQLCTTSNKFAIWCYKKELSRH
ncbi:U-box domain-containing protein 4 [Hibiscus syriacus]|uniref:RING-type E3 ubiquitin transferase n=1 Tax=Hibiscus syriacus TaxID=106335 RepID=A0A6A2ZU21_HIBSY|nr:U-box domain-containing protein 4 [Hibiscus syriacus]